MMRLLELDLDLMYKTLIRLMKRILEIKKGQLLLAGLRR